MIKVYLGRRIPGKYLYQYIIPKPKNKVFVLINTIKNIFLICFVFFVFNTKSVNAVMVESSTGCVYATALSSGSWQGWWGKSHASTNNNLNDGNSCQFNSGNVYVYDGGTYTLCNNAGIFTTGDRLGCYEDNGTIYASINGSVVCSRSTSITSGNYDGTFPSQTEEENFENYSYVCGDQVPTPTEIPPTPTPTEIPPTPTPTDSLTPTPTPMVTEITPTPTPSVYFHEVCTAITDTYSDYNNESVVMVDRVPNIIDTNSCTGTGCSIINISKIAPLENFNGHNFLESTDVINGVRLFGSAHIYTNNLGIKIDTSSQISIGTNQNCNLSGITNNNNPFKIRETSYLTDYNNYYSCSKDVIFDENGQLKIPFKIGVGGYLDNDQMELKDLMICFAYTDQNSLNSVPNPFDSTGDQTPEGIKKTPTLLTEAIPNECASKRGFDAQFCYVKNWFVNLFVLPSNFPDIIKNLYDTKINNNNGSFTSLLASIIFLPLNVISTYTVESCVSMDFPIPNINQSIPLPCPRSLLVQFFGNYVILWDIIATGFLSYKITLSFIEAIKNSQDPTNDDIKVNDI